MLKKPIKDIFINYDVYTLYILLGVILPNLTLKSLLS